MILLQISGAIRTYSGCRLNVAHSPGIARHRPQRKSTWVSAPFQLFDFFVRTAQFIHISPFGHSLQHVACSDTGFGHTRERIFVYCLVLVVLPISGCKNGKRKSLTLKRVRMTITDSRTLLIVLVVSVPLKVMRASILLLSSAVVADWGSMLESPPPAGQGSKVAMVRGVRNGGLGQVSEQWHRAYAWLLYCQDAFSK